MGFDAQLKRFFPAVLCLLIGLAAYFQASGLGHLVASSVAPDPSEVKPATATKRGTTPPPSTSSDHSTSGALILARNPFDSVTGPLDGRPDVPSESAPVADLSDPYAAPECSGAKVMLITGSDDPTWSFAAFAGGDGKSILRRQGDEVAGATVHHIGWDRVWMMQSGALCQALVGGNAVVAKTATPAVASTSKAKAGAKVPPAVADKIKKVGENQFEIERSAVDHIIDNQSEFMKSARIAPVREGDKIVGIRLSNIKQGSLLQMLGLKAGDVLKSINGFEMTDPQKALEAYARLRTADRLVVSVTRGGKDQNIEFNIK